MAPQLPTMTPQEFAGRWHDAGFGERQGAQSFFNDLCGLVGHATPAAYGDPEGFTFEKWVPGGFADAYFVEHFGWEFKGQDAQLDGAFDQLLRYQVHLKTPPLLIVSSFETIRIQTNFPGMETARYDVGIVELEQPDRLGLVRDAFFAPQRFRERLRSVDAVTRETASLFQSIVVDMEARNEDTERLAHYLNQLVFCLYSEDAGLLPEGLFTRIVAQHYRDPATFDRAIRSLFAQMATGGFSGADEIAHFNGDLFNVVDTVELSTVALQRLGEACDRNWRDIEPSIFGTLFERALDASKRAQTGAHYTGADDIELVVEPVVMTPLRREWQETGAAIDKLLDSEQESNAAMATPQRTGFEPLTAPATATALRTTARERLDAFRQRLASVKVLDPACGSGNFLYIALRSLLDLEREVIEFAAIHGWHGLTPLVKPDQMLGPEINHYAAELARTALWIGYIQWHQAKGFRYTQQPILTPLDTIRQTDAVLDLTDPEHPAEPEWPAAEFIVGNPPFLGAKNMRSELGSEYTNWLRRVYRRELDGAVDLCCYWFEKARAQIGAGQASRAGLLGTQGIRFSSNLRTLERIKNTGDIFAAYDDLEWKPEEPNSAAVHVSIVCFDDGSESTKTLNGVPASDIDTRLMDDAYLDHAQRLPQNAGVCFRGIEKGGPFDVTPQDVATMMADSNPNGQPNSDVVKRYLMGSDLNGRPKERWLIDFGTMPESEARQYNLPYQHCLNHVKPVRDKNNREHRRLNWWMFNDATPALNSAITPLTRYIGTSQVSKYRYFQFIDAGTTPNNKVTVFARGDDYFLGILESRFHKVWATAIGSQLREIESGQTYTITDCFEKFPFPTATERLQQAVADAAHKLDSQRRNVCQPNGIYHRSMTNLYTENPPWLQAAHADLDKATADAYGWPVDLTDDDILKKLMRLNLSGRAGAP